VRASGVEQNAEKTYPAPEAATGIVFLATTHSGNIPSESHAGKSTGWQPSQTPPPEEHWSRSPNVSIEGPDHPSSDPRSATTAETVSRF